MHLHLLRAYYTQNPIQRLGTVKLGSRCTAGLDIFMDAPVLLAMTV